MKEIDFYKPKSQEAIEALAKIDTEIKEHIEKYSFTKMFGLDVPDDFNEIDDIDEFLEEEIETANEDYRDEMDEDDILDGNYPDPYFVELFEMRNKRNWILETMFQPKTLKELRETPALVSEFLTKLN